MPTKTTCFSIIFLLVSAATYAQKIPLYTQHFANPYIYNPAEAGLEGRTVFALTYRQQWLGINDSPTTANFNMHTALKGGVNLGLNVTQDEAGIFKTSSGLFTFGYSVGLGWNHFISFGISGGAAFNSLDLSSGVNINDPALLNVLNNNTSLMGNAGLAYHVSDFSIGITLPQLFDTEIYGTQSFDAGEFDALSNYIITANYMIYFGMGKNVVQPYLLYRSYQGYESQVEGGLIVQFNDLFWVGGTYRQNYGYAGLLGLKLKNSLSVGFAYEIPATKVNGVNASTYEVQLTFRIGKKKPRGEKHATFLASEKVTKPKKEKKKEEPVIAEVPDEEPEVAEEPVVEEVVEESEEEIAAEAAVAAAAVAAAAAAANEAEVDEEDNEALNDPEAERDPVQTEVEAVPVMPVTDPTPTSASPGEKRIEHLGNHPFEIKPGSYVIVGAFTKLANAVHQADILAEQGFKPGYWYSSETKSFYVDVYEGDSPAEARAFRDDLRTKEGFEDAWYLEVAENATVNNSTFIQNENLTKAQATSVEEGADPPAVVTKKGFHPFELEKGHYVIVGVFGKLQNAVRVTDQLVTDGYRAGFGFSSEKNLFYVFAYKGQNASEVRQRRNQLRQINQFSAAWYLLVN